MQEAMAASGLFTWLLFRELLSATANQLILVHG
jgi:hypothetical protein